MIAITSLLSLLSEKVYADNDDPFPSINTSNSGDVIQAAGSHMEMALKYTLIGVGIAFPTAVGMSWLIARIFQRAKQGKPKGYLKQKLLLWCENKNLFPSIYVRGTGKWSIGKYVNLR